jgi:hypothetical protein
VVAAEAREPPGDAPVGATPPVREDASR